MKDDTQKRTVSLVFDSLADVTRDTRRTKNKDSTVHLITRDLWFVVEGATSDYLTTFIWELCKKI